MAAAIGLRSDFDAGAMGAAAKRSKDGRPVRRLLALAAIYAGGHAHRDGQDRRRDASDRSRRALKFNTHGPDGLIDRKAPWQAPRLNDEHRAALAAIPESGPIPAVHRVVRALADCRSSPWVFEPFGLVVSQQTLGRALRKMGDRKLSARPRHHAQAAGAIEDFKEASPSAWKRSGASKASIRET